MVYSELALRRADLYAQMSSYEVTCAISNCVTQETKFAVQNNLPPKERMHYTDNFCPFSLSP